MFIVSYDTEGVILCHGVPVDKTINSEYYQMLNIILRGSFFMFVESGCISTNIEFTIP